MQIIKPKESQIVKAILQMLKAMGAYAGKCKTTGAFYSKQNKFLFDAWQFRGFPDICCFFNKKLYFIEVKTPIGRQTPEQKSFELKCKEAGIPYILARSVDDAVKGVSG